jgi:diguanylate cyclase (GGDEF)-like protein
MHPTFEVTAFAPEFEPLPHARLPFWLGMLLRPLRIVPQDAVDRTTGLFNRAGLFAAVTDAVRNCRHVEASAIVLDFPDLAEVREIYGPGIARKVVAKLVRRLRALAGFRGMVGRTGPAQFTVVFAGANTAAALKRMQRVMGRPARVEFDAGHTEIVLVPEFIVDGAPGAGEGIQALYRDMCRELAQMQKSERRRLDHIASERQRHSRPMPMRG